MYTIGDIIRTNALKYPEKTGIVYEENRFKWRETEERVNRLAQALFKLGLKKGDGVGILSSNCHQWVETGLAIGKGGFRLIPLNMMLKEKELIYIINNSDAKLLIVDTAKTEMVKSMLADLPNINHVIGIQEGHGFDLDFETFSILLTVIIALLGSFIIYRPFC